jgi:hypothetical protein
MYPTIPHIDEVPNSKFEDSRKTKEQKSELIAGPLLRPAVGQAVSCKNKRYDAQAEPPLIESPEPSER